MRAAAAAGRLPPPRDPINALLSFLYALLTKELTVTLQAVWFDSMLGMLHQPRYGRPSLALDLAEEFRPLIADSTVLTLVNNGEVSPNSFIRRAGAVALSYIAERVGERQPAVELVDSGLDDGRLPSAHNECRNSSRRSWSR